MFTPNSLNRGGSVSKLNTVGWTGVSKAATDRPEVSLKALPSNLR